jgi:hypothetical protein
MRLSVQWAYDRGLTGLVEAPGPGEPAGQSTTLGGCVGGAGGAPPVLVL